VLLGQRAGFTRSWAQGNNDGMSVRELTARLVHSLWRGFQLTAKKETVNVVKQKPTITVRTIEGKPLNQVKGGSKEDGGRLRRWKSSVGLHGQSQSSVQQGASRHFNFISARKTLINNVLKRVTNSQAALLRRRAFHQLTNQGNSAPFLALVGVSLASGSGIITKEDEIESICYEIRQTVGKTRLLETPNTINQIKEPEQNITNKQWSLADFTFGKPIAKGCAAVVYSAKMRNDLNEDDDTKDYPLAVKMMFNYHAESNAFIILRAMHRETVPARSMSIPSDMDSLYQLLDTDKAKVESHPNIVEMLTVFTDQVPNLPGNLQLYGDALPSRLNPSGCGRNMSLFLVMKKYDSSLVKYLEQYHDNISSRTSLILLTQLLEGIAYLSSSGVAHRDLKSDNLLLSLGGGPQFPQLVITDFGCCLADSRLGLRLPYRTYDTDKGGNASLMAPEVALSKPGTFVNINYEKSDLWTAGTIAYEIFGGENPFYSREKKINSSTYIETNLPRMPGHTPFLVQRLVSAILMRDPSSRPTPRLSSTICQLLLWAPSHWYKPGSCRPPDTQELLQWLLTMTTKVVCESRWGNTAGALFEYQLVATFLATLSLQDVRWALVWIQENCDQDSM